MPRDGPAAGRHRHGGVLVIDGLVELALEVEAGCKDAVGVRCCGG